MKLNGSDIIAEVLIEQGVDTIFGYPGGAVLNIYDALYKYRDKIHHILTAHEQGASHAADGYARATGKTGVVIATSGPGATNLVTGIATAYMDSIPMVAITGNVGTSYIGKDAFQEVYITGITMPITKHNFFVSDIKELAPTLREAFKIANSGRKGPVLVDIPKDVTAAITEYEKAAPEVIIDNTVINEDEVKKGCGPYKQGKKTGYRNRRRRGVVGSLGPCAYARKQNGRTVLSYAYGGGSSRLQRKTELRPCRYARQLCYQ